MTPELQAALARAKRIFVTTWSRAGTPGTVPVWFMAKDGRLYFTTRRSSLKARRIRAAGRIRVSVGAPDGATFEAKAEWVDDQPALEQEILLAYRRKYPILAPLFLGRLIRARLTRKESVVIRITPEGPVFSPPGSGEA